jgi:acyl-CoA thioester hydrolase
MVLFLKSCIIASTADGRCAKLRRERGGMGSPREEKVEHLLKRFPVIVEIPVAWGEMDALKHVNNIVYFRYFENARIAYFDKLKFWDFMDRTGIGPILASTQCTFKAPLTFPDTVLAGTRTSEIKKDRFVMEHCVVSRHLQKIAAEGEAVLVTFDYRRKKKTALPEELKRYISDLENSVTENG